MFYKKIINNKFLKFSKKMFYFFVQFLSIFIPVKKNKITLIRSHVSGSNVTPVYYELKKHNSLDVELIDHDPLKPNLIFREIKILLKLLRSKIIVTTHSPKLKTRKNITIELWHCVAVKGMKLMSKLDKTAKPLKNIDYFNSYSDFLTNIDNAQIGINYNKFITFGAPRNDYLFQKSKSLNKILNIKNEQKKVIYVPTWRDKEIIKKYNCSYDEFIEKLSFNEFNLEKFNKFLEKHNIVFILKPHSFDNLFWKRIFKKINLSNFRLLSEEILKKNNISEFYQVLNQTDILVTDYSSIYIDWLLIDKPIIFTPTDYDLYNKLRNIVLQPYDFWTPGPKCITQEDFEKEILKSLNNENYYKKERETIKNIFHKHKDGKSSKRVADFIIKQIEIK